MKKKLFFTEAFVLIAVFTLALSSCSPNGGDTGISDSGISEPPPTVRTVIGYGYDITGRYAYSPDIKSAVLDFNKLQEAQLVKKDPNLRYGEFETITGKDINEYMRNITQKVSYSANAGFLKLVSFSGEVANNFDDKRITRTDYAFTTSTSCIDTEAYNIGNKDGLDNFFTTDFTNDLKTMAPGQIIKKYGTHVMLGAVLGARADYHLSVQKKSQDNITNLESYAKARAEVNYKGVTVGASTKNEVDKNYEDYFYTESAREKTNVLGGKPQYGQFIQGKQDYYQWIESIDSNNVVWIDYYPNSLVPISDFVTDKNKSNALSQAIEDYCKSNEVEIKEPKIGPTSFSDVDTTGNFAIKGGGQRNWLITPSFEIDGLRYAGYTKLVLTLNFDLKNELLINIGSRLYASFWKGHPPNTTRQYGEKFWTPALQRWEEKEFVHEISLADFENQLTVHWSTSSNASFTVGTRSITIEAKK
jgi:hypothetical protein